MHAFSTRNQGSALFFSLLILFSGGCTTLSSPSQSRTTERYLEMIEDWQRRINAEGWSEYAVDEIMEDCVKLTEYRMELDDHWDTPKEFFQRGFQGDCEDIAVFMMATLKNLGYPYQVRIAATRPMLGTEDHALVKVEMPNRAWKIFETTPMPSGRTDHSPPRPFIEFDEKNIFHLNPAQTQPRAPVKCASGGR
jgi:hypothetical protein